MFLPRHEYNILSNELAALNRAMEVILDQRGVDDLRIGNVYVYRAADGGVGCWFVDEQGNRLESIDYAHAEGKVAG